MDIDQAVEKARQIVKLMWELANDAQVSDMYSIVILEGKELKGLAPFSHLRIGDYDFNFNEADGFTASYVPKGEGGEYRFDPTGRLKSFTMPPKEKP